MPKQRGLELWHGRRTFAEKFANRRHGPVPESAWDNEVEEIQVRIEIERQPVKRNATADAHANSADFGCVSFNFRPNPNRLGICPGFDSERRECRDDGLFQPVDIAADGKVMVRQTDDRIGNELARSMEGYVAASV